MKKIFTLILFLASLYASAQQVNGSFDETWVDCVPWTSANNTTKVGTQPLDWTVSNVMAKVVINAPVEIASASTGYDETLQAVTLTNKQNSLMKSQYIPAYMTLGTTWNTATISGLLSIKVSKQDGGSFGGKSFTYKPDGIKFYYKRSHGTEDPDEPAIVTAYLWKGTWTQASVPGNIGYSTNSATMTNRDRNVLGMDYSQGGEVTKTDDAKLLAYLKEGDNKYVSIMGDATEWAEFSYEFTYEDSESEPEMINIIIAANDYFGGATAVGNENSITVDNVELIYKSSLSDLQFNGTTIDGFDKNVYEYNIDEPYNEGCIGFTKDCVGGEVNGTWDETTGIYSITVKGDDWSESNQNEHTYTITFKKNDEELPAIVYDFTPASTTPAEGGTAVGMSMFSMMFNDYVNINMENSSTITVYNAETDEAAYTGTLTPNWMSRGMGLNVVFDAPLAAGSYYITFAQGLFGNNAWVESGYTSGNANPELTYRFTAEELVVNTVPTTVTPADGTTLESLTAVKATFAHAFDMSNNLENEMPYVKDAEDNTIQTLRWVDINMVDNYTAIEFAIPETISTPGTYTVVVPEGVVLLMDDSYNTIGYNSKIEVTYIVTGEVAPVVYDFVPTSTNPENNGEGTGLSIFSMMFNDYVNIDYNQNSTINILDQEGNVAITGTLAPNWMSRGMGLNLNFDQILPEGTFTFTIPQGLFGNNVWVESGYTTGNANPELTFTFTNHELVVVTTPTSVIPENGTTLDELVSVKATFAHAFDLSYELDNEMPYVKDADGNTIQTLRWADINMVDNYTAIEFAIPETISTTGTYTVVIPEGIVVLMDDSYNTIGYNTDFEVTYTVRGTGISGIFAEEGNVTVYTINGVKVIDNKPASELKNLKKGMYIINGKTVVIK
ncbi:MAG: hypothetical protein IKA86_07070 [Paraprevotella sp.]|nr:hypothetical protein [Paraprevotella sp.]